MQATTLCHSRIERDVGAAPGHVGGHRDTARRSCGSDDASLQQVVAGVQHLMRQTGLLQHARQAL